MEIRDPTTGEYVPLRGVINFEEWFLERPKPAHEIMFDLDEQKGGLGQTIVDEHDRLNTAFKLRYKGTEYEGLVEDGQPGSPTKLMIAVEITS